MRGKAFCRTGTKASWYASATQARALSSLSAISQAPTRTSLASERAITGIVMAYIMYTSSDRCGGMLKAGSYSSLQAREEAAITKVTADWRQLDLPDVIEFARIPSGG